MAVGASKPLWPISSSSKLDEITLPNQLPDGADNNKSDGQANHQGQPFRAQTQIANNWLSSNEGNEGALTTLGAIWHLQRVFEVGTPVPGGKKGYCGNTGPQRIDARRFKNLRNRLRPRDGAPCRSRSVLTAGASVLPAVTRAARFVGFDGGRGGAHRLDWCRPG